MSGPARATPPGAGPASDTASPSRGSALAAATASLLLVLLAGCTPADFIAGRLARAPRAYPAWLTPEPRVYLGYQESITDDLPVRSIRVTPSHPVPRRLPREPITLASREVPPAAYNLRLTTTNWIRRGRIHHEFDFRRATPAPPLPGNPPPRGTVVLLHGYGLDHETLLPWALHLAERGWHCVLVDLRGHGRSTGRTISFGIAESADLSALLSSRDAQSPLPRPIVAFGMSYGGSLALRWAGQDPRIASVVAIAPYARLAEAAEGIRSDFASWVPAWIVRTGVRRLPAWLGVAPSELDPLESIRTRPVRALLVAGGADRVAPPSSVDVLHRFTAPGSSLLTVLDAGHEDVPFRFDPLAPAMDRWLDRIHPAAPSPAHGQ